MYKRIPGLYSPMPSSVLTYRNIPYRRHTRLRKTITTETVSELPCRECNEFLPELFKIFAYKFCMRVPLPYIRAGGRLRALVPLRDSTELSRTIPHRLERDVETSAPGASYVYRQIRYFCVTLWTIGTF